MSAGVAYHHISAMAAGITCSAYASDAMPSVSLSIAARGGAVFETSLHLTRDEAERLRDALDDAVRKLGEAHKEAE